MCDRVVSITDISLFWTADISTPAMPVWAISIISGEDIMFPKPNIALAPSTRIRVRAIQSTNWVRATRAIPMILPNISSVDFTLDTSTSTTRELFSSITEDITDPPNKAMNM